ncbi:MFS general substrate transporter [Lentinus tigrinus ALCF2SS1-7]|uniref:MFS general substrate transporter n=1 Tax=Lentinus tigrinus ALCF2SS1-6 TaxID=1328759 RepID=A0A5C2S029_9APHY|nr:MFS general substrate transporter [Lentinus tigrinus ALCF2SS1-6]RPD71578.1 MFS general substrate transporter [Lentinus tigrinus ALCF2SS1-7]
MSLNEAPSSRPQSTAVSTTDTLPAPMAATEKEEVSLKDFGFLPIPSRVRYDPDHPAHFGLLMNVTFGIASTFIVANLYYCQPLLIQFSLAFGVTYQEVSNIPTLVQAGYAVGLLFITPLGDLVRRRPLILILTFITASLTIGLAITSNLAAFEVLCFFVGVCTVVPQILMPLAVDLAPPERRASALSIVLSGLLFGVLIARVLAGVVAQFVTWRVVYYIAIGVQYAILLVLYWMLPDYPSKNKGTSYFSILYSMAKFCVTEPLLVQAILITVPSSATFTNWWVTLTFLLGGPPYNYSTVVIGLFGLVGMVGVAMAPLIGRTIDRLVPWSATLVGIIMLIITFAIQTAAVGLNVAVVIIVCIGLDIFRQTQQVSLTTAVLGLDASARSRLNAVLILSLFIGQVMGTAVGSKVFTEHGWRPDASLNLAWTGFTLFILLLRGPHVPRYTWLGWQGGFELRKSKVLERQQREREAAEESEKTQVKTSHGPSGDTKHEEKREKDGCPESNTPSEHDNERTKEKVGEDAV